MLKMPGLPRGSAGDRRGRFSARPSQVSRGMDGVCTCLVDDQSTSYRGVLPLRAAPPRFFVILPGSAAVLVKIVYVEQATSTASCCRPSLCWAVY